ncbi:N-acetylneuraminate synthase family protein [Candidatus Pelagibacter sp. HIMB1509]|uniref:N-acetylneuraminate synthase family protein n=1 Tax=Candidatus Pelagibacter sp. HIMB1509 TaxID=3413339 RepID=UPI003F87BCAB
MIKINNNIISVNSKTYIIAEIGINHNGDLKKALELIDVAKNSGADAVKFQKRSPKIAIPKRYWRTKKITPWGKMSYIDYKIKTELSIEDYNIINDYCKKKGITWFASCWDIQSVKDLHDFNLPCYKIASASITDLKLLKFISSLKKPIFLSTGMSSEKQISIAYNKIKKNPNVIMHCNSEYPSKYQDLNLKYINKLKNKYKKSIVGYSGHEISLIPTVAAVVLGAKVIERHITLDKSLWGSDHSCSLEPLGLSRLVKEIRVIEKSLGSAKKVITEGEKLMIKKLRKYK